MVIDKFPLKGSGGTLVDNMEQGKKAKKRNCDKEVETIINE